MNVELKAMFQLVFDGMSLVQQIVAKASLVQLFPGIFKIVSDAPAVAMSFNDLMPEINALKDGAADADLLSFVMAQMPGVTSDVHAQAIIAASLDLVMCVTQKAVALEHAIKG